MSDIHGVVYRGRKEGMNSYLERFAVETPKRTLAEIMEGADVFIGVSAGGIVSQDMIRSMADRPIVFAMANPDPEITYPDARSARDDVIMATGRSDYPNQINNVLCFPGIFRGALDCLASDINEAMKLAAAHAIADVIKEENLHPDYIIPSVFDGDVVDAVAAAVKQAAIDSGVARRDEKK